jgi:hypothetical protein
VRAYRQPAKTEAADTEADEFWRVLSRYETSGEGSVNLTAYVNYSLCELTIAL